MAKVLVTGGAGFIGSHIVDKLLDNNYDVVIIDNLSAGSLNNLQNIKNLKLYELDLVKDDIEQVFIKEKLDYIIHLAAQTSVNYSIYNPIEDANTNIVATLNLLGFSKKYNIKKFVAASSAATYGNPTYLPLDEGHPKEPLSPYGLSKLTMEKYIQISDVPYVIFRFSNAYGPRQKSSKESGVIAIFDKAMKNNEKVSIFGDGEQIRDFVYVEDIANVVIKSLESNVANEIINFSTNKGITLNQLFKEMKEIYNYEQDANYEPARVGDIKDSILDNTKLNKILSFNSFTGIKKGLEKLNNYEDN